MKIVHKILICFVLLLIGKISFSQNDTTISFILFVNEKLCYNISNSSITITDINSNNSIQNNHFEYLAGVLILSSEIVEDCKNNKKKVEISFNNINGNYSYKIILDSRLFNGVLYNKTYNIFYILDMNKRKYRKLLHSPPKDYYIYYKHILLTEAVHNPKKKFFKKLSCIL